MTRPGYILAILVPLGVVLGLLAADQQRKRGAVGRAEPDSRPAPTATSQEGKRDPVDYGGVRSRDFFYEDAQFADVGGERVRYQRGIYCARTAEGAGFEELTATDLVWLSNDPPKNRAAVERLVTIDASLGGPASGDAVRAAFGRVSGVKADRAIIRGDARLGAVRSLSLEGGVAAVFTDPEVPNDRVDVETPDRLVLEFEDGKPVRARAEGVVRVTRPRRLDAEIAGEGLTITFAREGERIGAVSSIVVDRKIVADLYDPTAVGLVGPSLRVAGQGPLTWRPKTGRGGAEGEASIELAGAIEGSRGDLRFRATRGRVTIDGPLGRRRVFEGEGGVHAEGDGFTLDAERTTIDARRDGTAVFYAAKSPGPPITVVLSGSHFPGFGDTCTLTCAGTATIGPSTDPFANATEVRRLHASTRVVATWDSGRLEAGDATLWTGRVDGRLRPLKVFLAMGVRGSTDEGDVRAEEFDFQRDHGPDGMPRFETFRLRRDYSIVYRGRAFLAPAASRRALAESRPESAPTTRPESGPVAKIERRAALGLLRSADVLEIEGEDIFEATRGVEPGAPSLASSKGRATYRLVERTSGRVAAKMSASRATIVIQPTTVEGPGGPETRRRVDSLSAEGAANVEVPGVASAYGGVIRLRLEDDEVVLTGTPERKARVTAHGPRNEPPLAVFDAGAFTWNAGRMRLTAEQGLVGDFSMRLLPWIRDRNTEPTEPSVQKDALVKTRATAGQAVVFFADGPDGADPTLGEIVATGGATIDQKPRRSASCSTFVVDLLSRSGTMTGAPLVYQAVRNEGGKAFEDWVRAPRAAFVGEEWSLDGPVEAVVHFAQATSALRLGVAPGGGTSDDASTPAPIRVLAKGGAVVRPDLMRLLGGVEAHQGRKDRGGFEARAKDATFLIVPGPDGSNDFSFAALRGEASFRSSGLTADGDVMTFDRPASTLTLYNERPAPVRFRVEGGFEAPTFVGATGLVAVFGKRTVSVTLKDVSTILEEEKAAGAGERK